jgi:hypothetical protein
MMIRQSPMQRIVELHGRGFDPPVGRDGGDGACRNHAVGEVDKFIQKAVI